MTIDPQIAARLCDRLDFKSATLAGITPGDPVTTALAVVRALRERSNPRMAFDSAWVRKLREVASEAEVAQARRQWEEALTTTDLHFPCHSNPLASLGAYTIQIAATDGLCEQTESWISGLRDQWALNVYSFGATASSVKLISWLWPLEECPDSCFVYLLEWLFTQADAEWEKCRSWGDTMLGPSGHNWFAHSYAGLFQAGVLFPEIQGAARWQELGRHYFEREVFLLFEDDGWSKEGSIGYHNASLRSLFQILHYCRLNEIALSAAAVDRFRHCMQAGWRLLMPDGGTPVFHDDGPRAPKPGYNGFQDNRRSLPGWLRFCAAYFEIPEIKQAVECLDPGYDGYVSHEGLDVTDAYRALPGATLPIDTCLPDGGLYVMRSGWGRDDDALAITAGSIGHIVASHKHVDIFNFELVVQGERMLVDNWYGDCKESEKNPAVRRWRVGSTAHNVATVDGEDHAEVQRIYRYGQLLPLVEAWDSADTHAYFSGAHEGYRRLGVEREVSVVRRKLFYLRGEYWILLDRFCPANDAEHTYQQHFHLKPEATLQKDGRLILQGQKAGLMIVPIPGLDGSATLRDNPYPVEGYENPRHLCYARQTSGKQVMGVLLVPFRGSEAPPVEVSTRPVQCDNRELASHEATALSIEIAGRRDLYFNQHQHWTLPWSVDDQHGQERVFHSRCQ